MVAVWRQKKPGSKLIIMDIKVEPHSINLSINHLTAYVSMLLCTYLPCRTTFSYFNAVNQILFLKHGELCSCSAEPHWQPTAANSCQNSSTLRRLAADHASLRTRELPPYYFFSTAETTNSDDLTQLTIFLTGPRETPYSQGVWKLLLKIPEDYPKSPPRASFRTKIWHPNVEENSGSVCVDTLKKDWEPKLTLRDVLIVSAKLKIRVACVRTNQYTSNRLSHVYSFNPIQTLLSMPRPAICYKRTSITSRDKPD